MDIPRRRALASLGALALTPWLPAHGQPAERPATPALTEGPFYPQSLPADRDADLTRVGGRGDRAAGKPLAFTGRLLDRRGRPLAGRVMGYFSIVQRPASEAALQPLLDTGQVTVAVVIPEGTQARLLAGQVAGVGIIVDGSDSQLSSVASGYASQIVARANLERLAELGLGSSAPGIDARIRVMFNPTLDPINTMIPALIAAILMISLAAIMSQAVVKERESGTLEQLFVTPVRPSEYIAGKVTPYAVLATVQMGLVAAVGTWWFGVPFYGNLAVVLLGLALFLLVCIGQGLLVSLLARTRSQAVQMTLFLMLPMIVLSGFIFPIASMPEVIQPFTNLIPLRHALDVLRASFIKGSGFADLALPLLALAGFAVAFFGSAVAATRRRITE